jgi:hypothetical protein
MIHAAGNTAALKTLAQLIADTVPGPLRDYLNLFPVDGGPDWIVADNGQDALIPTGKTGQGSGTPGGVVAPKNRLSIHTETLVTIAEDARVVVVDTKGGAPNTFEVAVLPVAAGHGANINIELKVEHSAVR